MPGMKMTLPRNGSRFCRADRTRSRQLLQPLELFRPEMISSRPDRTLLEIFLRVLNERAELQTHPNPCHGSHGPDR